MKYTVEVNGVVQVSAYIEVEADSPAEALEMIDIDSIPDDDYGVETWLGYPEIQKIFDENDTGLASSYDDHLPDV